MTLLPVVPSLALPPLAGSMRVDPFDPRLTLSRDERARLRVIPATYTELMVTAMFTEQAISATLAAVFALVAPQDAKP